MTRLNWRIISLNIAEAREPLEQLARLATTLGKRSETALEVGLSHAYHHLNFAWHTRRVTTKRFAKLSDRDFDEWGEFPRDVDLPRLRAAQAAALRPGTGFRVPPVERTIVRARR